MSPSVFKAHPIEGYEWAMPVADGDLDHIIDLDGSSRASKWVPLDMQLVHEDQGQEMGLESDFPWFGSGVLIVRKKAKQLVGPVLQDCGEFLPLNCSGTQLWLFNVTLVLDALDETLSKVVRFDAGGIMKILSPVFRPDDVRDIAAFKIPQAPKGPVFFGESFVSNVRSSGLVGIAFELVWTA